MANAKNSCLLFVGILLLPTNHCTIPSENITLSEVTLFLVREHLSNLTSTIVIGEKSSSHEAASTNALLMDYILQHLDGRIAVQFYLGSYLSQPLEYYIFIVDSLEAFKSMRHMFMDMDNLFERHFRFLIILTKFIPAFDYAMEEMFKLCYYFDVIDVNIIAEHPTKGVAMFTYFLYADNVCRRCVPVRLYNFNKGFDNLKTVFPEKLTNFHRCPFKVSARSFPPFFSFNGNTSDPKAVRNWQNIWGIEGTLLKFLALALNFTIDLQPFPVERSYVKEERTYGCFSDLMQHKVDIAVGGFVDSNPNRWVFSPTIAYHSSKLMYVIRGRRHIGSLARLAKPFTYEVWCFVAAFLFLNILFISVLKKANLKIHQFIFGEENHNPVTNFVALFLGYPVNQTPRRNFARYIFLHMLFLTLVLRNAYQGSLYDAFRMSLFALTPSGYEDLIKWNYTILLPPEAIQSLQFPQFHQIIKISTDGYDQNQNQRLKTLEALDGNYATVAIQDGYISYLQKNLRNGTELYLLPEVIYSYQFVLFLSKQSIFVHVINKKIKEFYAAGIMARLSGNFTSREEIYKSYLMKQSKKKALQNKRLYALYSICGTFIAVSVVVFCLEILSVHSTKLQRIFV